MFSPYYHWAGKRDPDDHVCVNVALYGPGARRWTMTERGRRSLSRNATALAIGPSAAEWDGNGLTISFDEVSVPIPKRTKGRVRIHPTALSAERFVIDGQERHFWWPVAPTADIEVELSEPSLSWRGHGYFDSNWGSEPIERGFRRWDWSRAPLSDGTAILYDGIRRAADEDFRYGFRFTRDGACERFEPGPRTALGRGFWGVDRFTAADADAARRPRIAAVLEDSPFYARTVLETTLFGEQVTGVHESLSGDRFMSPVVKAMLPFRMPRRA